MKEKNYKCMNNSFKIIWKMNYMPAKWSTVQKDNWTKCYNYRVVLLNSQ